MAEAQLFESQNKITCSVCLDTLTDPVTIPCGHSFCLKCHTDCWDQSQLLSCPQCREKFKKTGLRSPPSQKYAGPGDVECDACTGKKFRAVKSCLTCPASYCQTHLQPHFQIAAWKDHKLGDPDGNLKEKLCVKHQKSLEIFCETDDACICTMCGVTEHNGHKMVKLEMEREDKEVSGEADRKLTEKTKEQEKREMEKAEGVMEQLEKEIEEQKKREAELKELSETKDHLHFLQVRATLHRKSDQTGPVTHSQISSLVFFSLLSDFCPFTLDINTAHRQLHLSEGNKKVTREWTWTKYPDHPDRFDYWPQFLCTEALTGTHCYWEVECSGDLMMIGVAYKGLSRKGDSDECHLGHNKKSWCLQWSDPQYSVRHNNQETVISAPYSPRIGVYLGWTAGSLSFYSVSHTMTLLHRFNTSFTEPLYPGFYVGLNSSVTISHQTPCDH
uniref:Tripartite motif-containing protein 16-like n=1 Tax=Erpetoichthys calabaricus TaxID=27687 RepID=A0A8C4RGV5_ERPCA